MMTDETNDPLVAGGPKRMQPYSQASAVLPRKAVADVLEEVGSYDEVESVAREALKIRRELLGKIE